MKEVASYRTRLGWSQAYLAERSGISVRTLRRLESGETVASKNLEKVFAALSLDIDAFDDTAEAIEASQERIESTPYIAGLSMLEVGIFILMLLGVFSASITTVLWIEGTLAQFAWVLLGLPLMPLGAFLFWRYYVWQERLGQAIGPDSDRLIRAIAAGRLRILSDRLHGTLNALRHEAFQTACNSKLASVSVLHQKGSFGFTGIGAKLRSTGNHCRPEPAVVGKAMTRKEVAWQAGVDPRTLRRLERGESMSPKSRNLVREVVSDRETMTEGMEERYVTALQAVTDAFQSNKLFWAEFSTLFLVPAILALSLPVFSVVMERDVSFDTIGTTVSAAYLVFLALTTWLILRGRQERSKVVRDMNEAAGAVLDGIRMGMIRHLSTRQYGNISLTIGERRLLETMEMAPTTVRIL